MKLTLEQIRTITSGASRIEEIDGRVNFFRFTKEQEDMYLTVSKDFWAKTFATAGVKLEFVTDSARLVFSAYVGAASSRTYFNHDIYINGEHTYTLGTDVRTQADGKHVTVRGEYELGEGEKKVCIYMPWSAKSRIETLELDDGASVAPVEHKIKMINFGDSITHGYDAANPSQAYSALITDALDACSVNKGIGGEVFRAELALLKEDFEPDIITVAYGTNDWSHRPVEHFEKDSEGFFKNLSRLYPNAKIFALSPIWRGDVDKATPIGAFENVGKMLGDIAKRTDNVTLIDCYDFVPHEATMFSSDVLHPNFLGFSYYADGVVEAIKKHI